MDCVQAGLDESRGLNSTSCGHLEADNNTCSISGLTLSVDTDGCLCLVHTTQGVCTPRECVTQYFTAVRQHSVKSEMIGSSDRSDCGAVSFHMFHGYLG